MTKIDWVNLEAIDEQRRKGWPDFHPEHYCHRCGHKNVSWYTDAATWNQVVLKGDPWNGIICIPCFIGLAEVQDGPQAWRITRDQYGTEVLTKIGEGVSG